MKTLILRSLYLLISFTFGIAFNSFSQGSKPILPGNNPNPFGICETPPPGCQEIPICTYYDDCFRFDFYAPKDKGDGTTVLKHKITNFSESTFKRATFELPGTGPNRTPAVLPLTSFQNRYDHSVINPLNGTPANSTSIAYDAINAGTFSYGGFEVYYYIVNTADFLANGKLITVTAQAGRPWQLQRTGTIVVDVDDCVPPGPPGDFCIEQEDENFFLGYPFWEVSNGQIPMSFTLQNKTSAPIDYIEIEGGASYIISPANGSNYNSPSNVPPFTYSVSNNSTILRYTGTSTAGFVNGATDVFNFTVDAATYFNDIFTGTGGIMTVRVRNTSGTLSEYIFETAECGEIVPLPVSLTSFKGKASSEGITLNWTTASEKDNARFEVERSEDGRNFEKIGMVKGSGNSSTVQSYDYLDTYAKQGQNFYRLKQVDYNGKYEYTHIIAVRTDERAKSFAVQLLPNPCAGEQCSVKLQATDQINPVTIEIQDLAGRIVYSKQLSADQTSFELPKLNTGGGIYILNAKNGEYTAHQKILLQ